MLDAQLADLDPGQSRRALAFWIKRLLDQEASLWELVNGWASSDSPQPYDERSPLLNPTRHDPVQLVAALPQNEVELTSTVLSPSLKGLVEDLFRYSGLAVTSSLLGHAYITGSGTSDISLRQPAGLSHGAWLEVEKFVVEVKLLSPDVSLHSCTHG